MQRLLWDRRLVLALLDAVGVPTPPRIIINRDRCKVDPSVIDQIKIATGVEINLDGFCEIENTHVEMVDEDTVKIGGQILKKPFVEKPVDADDHNVYIYYSKEMGGGGRRLFRKVSYRVNMERIAILILPKRIYNLDFVMEKDACILNQACLYRSTYTSLLAVYAS